MNIFTSKWQGEQLGNITCGIRSRWGLRIITSIDNISIVRLLDPDGILPIIDEFGTFFELPRCGTVRFRFRGYNYTGMSFMAGEYAYDGSEYELNEICDRLAIYYSWWNIGLKTTDFYCRHYNTKSIVAYPNTSIKLEEIVSSHGLSKPNLFNEDFSVETWLHVYSEDDINLIVNKARNTLEAIINKINPDLINLSNIITSRIRNFLFFYLVK